jgi:hypothetical protein
MLGVLDPLEGEIDPPDDQPVAPVAAEADTTFPILVGLPAERQRHLGTDRVEAQAGKAAGHVDGEHARLRGIGAAADHRIELGEARAIVGQGEVAERQAAGIERAVGAGHAWQTADGKRRQEQAASGLLLSRLMQELRFQS